MEAIYTLTSTGVSVVVVVVVVVVDFVDVLDFLPKIPANVLADVGLK